MCLSIPGKVVEINGEEVIVDYGSEKRKAFMSVVSVKIGDYVIMSNKIIVNKIPHEQAIKYLELVNQKNPLVLPHPKECSFNS